MPPDLVKILRKTFDDTMKDPAFVADMERTRRDVSAETGEAMVKLLEEVAAFPPETLSKLVTYTAAAK